MGMDKMTEEIIKVICAIPFEQWHEIDYGVEINFNDVEISLKKDLGSLGPYLKIDDLILSNDMITDLYVKFGKMKSEKKVLQQQNKIKEIYNKIVNAK
jgi:hypothetical protein